jgi:hypothetical protein
MKIQLEHKLRSCPEHIDCISCGQAFPPNSIRALLCLDSGLIEGDLCPKCIQQGAARIRWNLRDRAAKLILQEQPSPADQSRALELRAAAVESLTLPPAYQWWWKKLGILTTEACELELARRGLNKPLGQKLHITFLEDKPSVGQDT